MPLPATCLADLVVARSERADYTVTGAFLVAVSLVLAGSWWVEFQADHIPGDGGVSVSDDTILDIVTVADRISPSLHPMRAAVNSLLTRESFWCLAAGES